MKYIEEFHKKFLVGLTLKTTAKEFDKFLAEYSYYIEQIYFSIPLGEKFHSRIAVQQSFESEENVALFWQLLEIAKNRGIKLDMVLNTPDLTAEDVSEAFTTLKEHGMELDVITTLDEYYDYLTPHLTNEKIFCSYNNAIRSISDIKKLGHSYDSYVLGNSLMRAKDVHRYIVEELGKKVCLLINNGCSFNCEWCGHSEDGCERAFKLGMKKHTVEYLYAHQGVFPEELRNGTVNMEYIDTVKISNRSSDIRYLKRCMDSYVNNRLRPYLLASRQNYSLWCKLLWFSPYYHKMSFRKIMQEKKKIYEASSEKGTNEE